MAGELAETIKASDVAQKRLWDVERRISDLGRKRSQSDRAEGELVEALLVGRPLAETRAAADERDLAGLDAEVAALKKARDRLRLAIEDKRSAVDVAELRVAGAARDVVATSIDRLMKGAAELQAELVRRRLALHAALGFVSGREAGRSDAARSATTFMGDAVLPGLPDFPMPPQYATHSELKRWEAAVEALHRDADAPLTSKEG